MDKICTKGQIHGIVSPLCGNTGLYLNLKKISNEHGVSFNMMLSISYAESHIGSNFSKPICSGSNNWGGMKAYKRDDGTYGTIKLPTSDGCRLYRFTSVEEYWNALANSLNQGYRTKGCETASCISQRYVGKAGSVKQGRVDRVNSF